MGAWGHGGFENDDALDFVADLTGEPTWDAADRVFTFVNESVNGEYLEAPDASSALAAAEAVAAALGRPAAGLPEELADWIPTVETPGAERVERARRAAERVRRGSELQGLWDDSPDAALWHQSVDELLRRLGSDNA